MTLYASWVHGNTLTVESPENLARVGHFGWGVDMETISFKETWIHIPLPTPVIVADRRTNLLRVFLLFSSDGGRIKNVHVYDGSSIIQEFNDLFLEGEHLGALNIQNTFNLAHPHTVVWGVGISFFYAGGGGFEGGHGGHLIVGAAGGDFFHLNSIPESDHITGIDHILSGG